MIEDRDSLIDAVMDWLDDPNLESRVPTFIQFAEARLNRLLDDPDMEVISQATAISDYTALPDDFGEMISITTGDGALQAMGPVEFSGIDHSISGTPRFYSIVNRSISFAPSNTTAPITMVYRRRIPALTEDNTTNWLLDRAPDAYLYGCLVQAAGFNVEVETISGWKSALDEAIAELRMDGNRRKYGSGPLAPRIRRI